MTVTEGLIDMTVADQTLFGVPVAHAWTSLWALERILVRHPFRRIVEIGTGGGGVTVFFALHARARRLAVLSIDLEDSLHTEARVLLESLPVDRVIGDFADHSFVERTRTMTGGPTLIYCDNGHKVREFRTFAPLLLPGDVVMAHDYPFEITAGDVAESVATEGLVPFHQEFLDR